MAARPEAHPTQADGDDDELDDLDLEDDEPVVVKVLQPAKKVLYCGGASSPASAAAELCCVCAAAPAVVPLSDADAAADGRRAVCSLPPECVLSPPQNTETHARSGWQSR